MEILVCASDYFRIDYEINPWMSIQNNANKPEVLQQYRLLLDAFTKAGIKYKGIEPNPEFPDMVYTANYGFIYGNKFIAANFRFQQRKGETDIAIKYFKQLGYKTYKLPDNIYFEGEGDLLVCGKKYFLGWGKRTMKEALPYIKEIVDGEVIDLELVDPFYYHLDTCFAPLNENIVVINPKSFTAEGIGKIRKNFQHVIETSDEDNKVLACNLIVHENNIVVGKGISSTFKSNLEKYGFSVFETPMSQYIKGGGSVKCCSLILDKTA